MAGSATITGRQHYILGIGHPLNDPLVEAAPAVFSDDGSLIGPNGVVLYENTYYDIRRAGCIPGAGQNNLENLRTAFANAAALGIPAYIPPGEWRYAPATDGEMLTVSCSIIGSGPDSKLVCNTADGNRSRLDIPGTAADLYFQDFQITAPNSSSAGDERGIGLRGNPGGTRLKFSRMHFGNTKGVPILLRGITDSQVSGVYINTAWKDGVHITGASRNVQVSDVFARNSGDDTVAVVGYIPDGVYPQDISITNVHINVSVQGRGVSVVGGRRVRVTGVYGYQVFGAVVYAASEGLTNTYLSEDVQFSKVIGIECGQVATALSGLQVTGRVGQICNRITFEDVLLINSKWRGISVLYGKDVLFRNVKSVGNAVATGVEVSNTENFTFDGGGVELSNRAGLFIANTVTGRVELRNLVFRDVSTSATAGDDVINIAASSTASEIVIDNVNHLSQATAVERFIENANAGITKYGSVSSVIEGRLAPAPFSISIPTTAVTVTASPFVYQNATNDVVCYRVIGGTISQVRRSPDGTNWFVVPSTKALFEVRPGHRVETTYSVAHTAEVRAQSLA